MKPLYNYYSASMLLLVALLALSSQLCAQQTIRTYIDNDWPDSRYIVHTDNTVTDTRTNLMWQRCSTGQYQTSTVCVNIDGVTSVFPWLTALEMAQDATTGGYTDWRLPNIKELASLAAYDRNGPAINLTAFPNTPTSSYWVSSPAASLSGTAAYLINFNLGSDGVNFRTSSARIRLVRDGPVP